MKSLLGIVDIRNRASQSRCYYESTYTTVYLGVRNDGKRAQRSFTSGNKKWKTYSVSQ